eukprot:TRINITY_DN73231_c0_g1_i1.p1 TRINITY_DN73231_c0_g1~~TRINITY_DN73231_c0_g1_i1.p1  ORF type:complete len:692 (+),score=150.75 TRINITY_DN73231_c0_g1_i1:77-2152(+)
MGKDRMMDNMAKQQQKWEKKKEKMEKKENTERGAMRKGERELKKVQKEEMHKEQKDTKAHRSTPRRIHAARMAAVSLYVVSMGLFVWNRVYASADQDSASSWGAVWPSVLTALLVVAITVVEDWHRRILRDEEQREAADAIKSSLERKQTAKEREAMVIQRRQLHQKEVKERQLRRAKEEASALQQARELARALRKRREERETQEAKERKERETQDQADEGNRDEHGWTAGQLQRLRQAVKTYPENWSHSRKQRWDMISSEVGGHNARTCEEAFLRMEAEVRAAAANSKADTQTTTDQKHVGAAGLEDDFDWLEGGANVDQASMGNDDWEHDAESDDGEDEEDDEQGQERMAVELEPEHKGTEIRLDAIKSMQGCATVQIEVLHLQLACVDCKETARLFLSGADEDAAGAKTWCEGCSGLIAVRLRPTLLHVASTRLGYVDCTRCIVTDVLPSVLMSTCDACSAENVHKHEFVRNRVISGSCFQCHAKYAFGAESIRIEQVTPCESGPGPRQAKGSTDASDDPMDELAEELRWLRKKAKTDPRQQLIRLGSSLPQMGACRHFKKSYKWYRFACCGRAFPCPECHVESGCPAAGLGAHASRMICGKCCMEQSYSPNRPCEKCNFAMVAKGSSHWDGGGGTRSLAAMSTKDSKKFKGGLRQVNSKTKTSSGKAERVGAKAKAIREHERKFGKS